MKAIKGNEGSGKPCASRKRTRAGMTSGPSTEPKNRSAVVITAATAADMDAAVARTLTRPEVGSAAVIEAWAQGSHDVNELVTELTAQVEAVNTGEMKRAEGILISQAHTLDAIFVNLMRRATHQKMMLHWETYMRMGMKAQTQCRATLQALAELKNPPMVFAKQANISSGLQQVNNGVMSGPKREAEPVRAHEEAGNQQSKLLEDGRNGSTYLDSGATPATAGGHQVLEAMGAVHRTEEHGRQG